ncbi:MAG: peptidoglycan-binding protein [bacterium]|nr:peptidoglycan-binding protein [bacterium]
MSTLTSKSIAKVAAVATGLAMATSMLSLAPTAYAAALTSAQVSSIIGLLQSFGADAATIANVQASLTGGTPTAPSGGPTVACTFSTDLHTGSSGSQVTCLQQALIAGGYSIPAGATGYFGSQTKAAVIAWQKASGVSPAFGYFGSISRAAFNLAGGTPGTPSTPGTPGTPGTPAPTGSGLGVMLSPTSPNGQVLVAGQAIGNIGDYVFANPTGSPINVTSVTFNRTGVSNDTTLTNIYLYNGGTRLTDSAGISASQFKFSDTAGLFTVPAGGTVTVSVRSDIATGTSGQQIGTKLVAVSSSGTLDASVSFPIMSGYQTVSAATLAGVDWGATVTPSSAVTVSAQNDYPLWQNTVSISSNPVKLTSVRFTNLGSANAPDVVNLKLYVDGAQVGSTVAQMNADRSVTFDFSAAPLSLTTSSHVVKVLGNLLSSGSQKTVTLSIQRSSDAMFVDSQLNQPVTPTSNGSGYSAESAAAVTIQYASNAGVSTSLDPASPTANVGVGASNVKWGVFQFLASGEDVKVKDLYVYADTSVHAGGLDNGKIMVNGVQVGSTKDIVEGNGASIAYGSATDFSLGSSLILPGGQTTKVEIWADAKSSTSTNLSNNETVKIHLSAGSSNGQGVSSLTSTNVPAANTAANEITISSSSLTAAKYTGYGNQTMIKGANSARIGAFTLSTGQTEGVLVNTIGIQFAQAVSSTITNLTLKNNATGAVLGTIITTPGSSADADNAFAVNLDIPASSNKTIDIYANILSGADSGTLVPKVNITTTGTGSLTGQSATVASDVSLQTMTLGSGTLSVAVGAGDPGSNNVIAGAASVQVGQFNFSAANSAFTVQNLAILIPNTAATSVSNVTLSYKDVNGVTQTASQTLTLTTPATETSATATFTGLTMYVPANSDANLDVFAGISTIASGATSSAAIIATLDDGNGSSLFKAIDDAGTALTKFNANNTNIASGGTHYVRKSVPTIASLGAQPSFATGAPFYKFSVTADAAGAVEWSKITFTLATTTATITAVYLADDSTGVNLLDNTSTSASTTATQITVDLTKNAVKAKYAQVAAGVTKTYALYGTITTGTTYNATLSLTSDTSAIANEPATTGTGNFEWSDRSYVGHAISTADWTNGNLLKNFTSTAVTYQK